MGPRERKMLMVLGFLVYVFLFYKFNWLGAVPEIDKLNEQLEQEKSKQAEYEANLKNIDKMKLATKSYQAKSEHLEIDLMSRGDMIDSMEYIYKLLKVFDKVPTDVLVMPPEIIKATGGDAAKASSGADYTEFAVEFQIPITVGELTEMFKYVEDGTKKAKITALDMTPHKSEQQLSMQELGTAQTGIVKRPSINDVNQLYDVKMKFCFYSMDTGKSNKFNDYKRHKLGRFLINNDEILNFLLIKKDGTQGNFNLGGNTSLFSSSPYSPPGKNIKEIKNKDIEIVMENYYAGGANFNVYGRDKNKEVIELKTSNQVDITISLSGYYYSVEVVDSRKSVKRFSGRIPSRDINLFINTSVPNFDINQNYFSNIKIINDSAYNVLIDKIESGTRNKFVIRDRNNSIIVNRSESENVYF